MLELGKDMKKTSNSSTASTAPLRRETVSFTMTRLTRSKTTSRTLRAARKRQTPPKLVKRSKRSVSPNRTPTKTQQKRYKAASPKTKHEITPTPSKSNASKATSPSGLETMEKLVDEIDDTRKKLDRSDLRFETLEDSNISPKEKI